MDGLGIAMLTLLPIFAVLGIGVIFIEAIPNAIRARRERHAIKRFMKGRFTI